MRFVGGLERAERQVGVEQSAGLQVHVQVKRVGSVGKVHNWFVNGQERQGVRRNDFSCFVDALHVVGKGGDGAG